jgi:hypothetical protein
LETVRRWIQFKMDGRKSEVKRVYGNKGKLKKGIVLEVSRERENMQAIILRPKTLVLQKNKEFKLNYEKKNRESQMEKRIGKMRMNYLTRPAFLKTSRIRSPRNALFWKKSRNADFNKIGIIKTDITKVCTLISSKIFINTLG